MSNPFVLWIQLASATALMCLFANQGNAQWTGPVQNELTIVGGWLFDGTTSELRTNPGIVIRNGRIVAVGSLSEMEFSEGAPVVELDSKATILPGFMRTIITILSTRAGLKKSGTPALFFWPMV